MNYQFDSIVPTKDNEEPVVIIGFGVAGFNAAVGLRSSGYEGAIDVFSNIDTIPYSPIMTSYYAAGLVSHSQCFPWSQNEIDQLRLNIHNLCPVEQINTATHTVKTAEGVFTYSKCIIATGASPVVFGFEELDDYQPLVLHSMEDAERLRSVLSSQHCTRVLISGASMVAVKMLEAALIAGKDCTLVGMNEHILDMTAFPPAALRFEERLKEQGVNFRFNQTIKQTRVVDTPNHPDNHALEVTFSNGDTDIFDEILAAHGFRSDLSLIKDTDIMVDRGILVNEYMQTSNPDVYAAGDIAQALELISNTPCMVGIWKNAAVQGLCAGRAIASEIAGAQSSSTHSYKGSIASNTISCNGPLFISAGPIEILENRYTEVIEDDDMTIVYLYEQDSSEQDRLIGFNICADEDIEGGVAYDLGGMLTRQILEECS